MYKRQVFKRESDDDAIHQAVGPINRVRLRYGSSLRQGVCNENWAAWVRLWPGTRTGGLAAGLADLLCRGCEASFAHEPLGDRGVSTANAEAGASPLRKAFGTARYSSLTFRLLHRCAPTSESMKQLGARQCERPKLWLRLGLSAVIPRPHAEAESVISDDFLAWVLGRQWVGSSIASSSTLAVQWPVGGESLSARQAAMIDRFVGGCGPPSWKSPGWKQLLCHLPHSDAKPLLFERVQHEANEPTQRSPREFHGGEDLLLSLIHI